MVETGSDHSVPGARELAIIQFPVYHLSPVKSKYRARRVPLKGRLAGIRTGSPGRNGLLPHFPLYPSTDRTILYSYNIP